MSPELAEFEQRLASVETALTQVQQKLGLALPTANWIEQFSVSLADIPDEDYQRFLDCCRAVRTGDALSEAEEMRP